MKLRRFEHETKLLISLRQTLKNFYSLMIIFMLCLEVLRDVTALKLNYKLKQPEQPSPERSPKAAEWSPTTFHCVQEKKQKFCNLFSAFAFLVGLDAGLGSLVWMNGTLLLATSSSELFQCAKSCELLRRGYKCQFGDILSRMILKTYSENEGEP